MKKFWKRSDEPSVIASITYHLLDNGSVDIDVNRLRGDPKNPDIVQATNTGLFAVLISKGKLLPQTQHAISIAGELDGQSGLSILTLKSMNEFLSEMDDREPLLDPEHVFPTEAR